MLYKYAIKDRTRATNRSFNINFKGKSLEKNKIKNIYRSNNYFNYYFS